MAMFYGDDDDTDEVRFKFEMRGKNELIIIGAKPGKARGKNSNQSDWTTDATVERILAFSLLNWNYTKVQFNGFLLLNISAQSDIGNRNLKQNLCKIDTALNGMENVSVLLAYGDIKRELKDDLKIIVKQLHKQYHATFFQLGDTLTSKKNPRQICPRNLDDLPITTSLQPFDSVQLTNLLK